MGEHGCRITVKNTPVNTQPVEKEEKDQVEIDVIEEPEKTTEEL